MSSEIVEPLAQQIAEFITEITGLSTGQSVNGYRWERKAFDAKLPVGVVGIPTIRRTAPGERESQIGTDDWDMEFPVGLYFDLGDPVAAQQLAVETVERFIRAVDENPSLGDDTVVDDAAVLEAEPEVLMEQPRALLIYRCRLAVIKQVPSPP
jgi:hypothetical protein